MVTAIGPECQRFSATGAREGIQYSTGARQAGHERHAVRDNNWKGSLTHYYLVLTGSR